MVGGRAHKRLIGYRTVEYGERRFAIFLDGQTKIGTCDRRRLAPTLTCLNDNATNRLQHLSNLMLYIGKRQLKFRFSAPSWPWGAFRRIPAGVPRCVIDARPHWTRHS
jgi:hypothetical protein